MAEQSTTQQKDQKIVSTILANIGTIVCFRTGSFDDEKTLIPLFRPYIDDGEISNLSQYNFYMRVLAGKPQEPLSGETIVSDRSRYNSRKRVINCSRTRYTKSMNDSNDSSKK